jgi:O-methyltransferase involved in polyketide biosynthesis
MLAGVSKTAILTLRARVEEQHREDRTFEDPQALAWWSHVAWPPELDRWYGEDTQRSLALRAADIDHIVRRYAEAAGSLAVTELGCGFSTRRTRLAELPLTAWFDVDLPPVAELRRAWGAGGVQLGASVLDLDAWLEPVAAAPGAHLIIAEGLLYYLPRADVTRLMRALAQRLPGAAFLMDVVGRNDAPVLAHRAEAVGSPIAWTFTGDYDDVLAHFELGEVPRFEPDRLMQDMLTRYWARLDRKTRGLVYFAMHQPLVWSGRSGMVLGRLGGA